MNMQKILGILLVAAVTQHCFVTASADEQFELDLQKAMAASAGKEFAPVTVFVDQDDSENDALIAAMLADENVGGAYGYSGYRKDLGDRKKRDLDDEAASLALIEAMQIAERGGGGFGQSVTAFKVQTHAKVADHRKTFVPIVELLKVFPQGADVHGLDVHVAANLGVLNAIGDDLGVDNAALTAANMKDYFATFLKENPDFYKGYEGTAVNHAQLLGYIDAALATASAQVSTLQMYSRIVSLIQLLDKDGIDTRTYLQHLFDAFSENYLTQGGCFEGVRNRAYIRYVAMLHSLMGA